MMKQQTLGFVAGFLWITSGVARSEASEAPHQTACAIELARSKSPHNYLVAVVERNEPTCDANLCLANLGVIKIISAGDLSLQPASIDVRYSVKGVHKGGEYPKGSSIGVFIPYSSGKIYRWLEVTFPAISTAITRIEEAAEIAESNPTGAPNCEKKSEPEPS